MERFKTLKDHVYDYIEAQIQSGSLRPNQRINEAVICEVVLNDTGRCK